DVVSQLRPDQNDDRHIADPLPRSAAAIRAACAVPQLADHPACPIPVLLARPGLGEMLQAWRRDLLGALSQQTDSRFGDVDLPISGDERIERLDAEPLRAQPTTGT